VLGDILSYTLSPIISRLLWPLLLRKIFGPAPVLAEFHAPKRWPSGPRSFGPAQRKQR
jgi:hypothetical protein